MKNFQIYLSGGMSGLTMEEQNNWRSAIKQELFKHIDDCYKPSIELHIFNPVDHFNYFEKDYKSKREVMEYNLTALRNSDLVLVNFNAPNSIGTAFEVAIAKDRGIPVIGLNESGTELHPWLVEGCTRMCDTLKELIKYTKEFYLC